MTTPRLIVLTTLAMLAFAANSVLARLAFATAQAEPLSYPASASPRALLPSSPSSPSGSENPSASPAAAALFGYALAFSVAYLMLGAGTGALILFASVQLGILGWAVWRGDRPGLLEWLGLSLAFAGFAWLVAPDFVAPDPLGAALMVGSGRLYPDGPRLLLTARRHHRQLPPRQRHRPDPRRRRGPPAYAAASGAIASGLGYAIWYSALPALTRTRAAIVQLTIPALAALGGITFIGEPLTARLVVATLAILGGIALAVLTAARRRR